MPDDSARQPIGYWIKRLDEVITAAQAQALARDGLSRFHWQTLNSVEARGGAADRAEVFSILRVFVDAATFDAIVAELVRRRWVEADAGRLVLTDDGRAGHATLMRSIGALRSRALEGISPEEYTAVIRLLQRMVANLEAGDSQE